MSQPALPRITILLCTFNGAAHLQAQLDSYLAQEHGAWDLWISDDGSTDGTLALARAFRDRAAPDHAVRIVEGPRAGGTRNFLSLLCHPELPPGPVALSDQDDVWLPDKLARAARALQDGPPVLLYGAQSRHVDADLRPIGRSRPPRRPPSFSHALVQNMVSGHSTVLSADALALVRRAGVPEAPVPYQDWWLYQLVAGAGGTVRVETEIVLLYRQHHRNAMGAHQGLPASLRRAAMVLGRRYGDWLEANMEALSAVSHLLTPEARAKLAAIRAAPRGSHAKRALAFAEAGLYRQTRVTTAALYIAALLGRI